MAVGAPATLRTNIAPEGSDAVPDGTGGDGTDGPSCTQGAACASGPACISGRTCIPSALDDSCQCAGTVAGTCYPGTVCSPEGALCGDGNHACCVGLTCTNGTCEGPSGRCP